VAQTQRGLSGGVPLRGETAWQATEGPRHDAIATRVSKQARFNLQRNDERWPNGRSELVTFAYALLREMPQMD
jgi:hypothetical protein